MLQTKSSSEECPRLGYLLEVKSQTKQKALAVVAEVKSKITRQGAKTGDPYRASVAIMPLFRCVIVRPDPAVIEARADADLQGNKISPESGESHPQIGTLVERGLTVEPFVSVGSNTSITAEGGPMVELVTITK